MPEPDRNSFVPLYHQLRVWIEEQIRSGDYGPGALLPSERELCDRFRLSNITVRKALAELVHAGLIYRQNGVGSFVSTPATRRRLALVVIGFGESWWRGRGVQFSALIGGIARVTCDTESQFTMVYLDSERDLAGFIRSVLDERTFDGLLLRSKDPIPESDLNTLEERGLPYVVVRHRAPFRVANCVRLADEEEGYMATRHLLELGHLRIAYIGGERDNPALEDRLLGYRRALQESGMEPAEALVKLGIQLESGESTGRQVVSDLLDLVAPPTAFVVATSTVVGSVYYALRDRGLRIPGEISLVGADEDVAGSTVTPPLTRFGRSHFDLGTRATELLIQLINGEIRRPVDVVLPPSFIVGGSTARPGGTTNGLATSAAVAADSG